MPHNYTVTDQVNFLEQWFDSWSDFQKEDFLPVLAQAVSPKENVNGLVDSVRTLQVGQRRPSLFDCQVKLFQEWIDNWTEAEKNQFLEHIKVSDPEFNEMLNKCISQEQEKIDETQAATESSLVESSHVPTAVVVTDNEKDDGVSHGSPTSSPLSSLSQPQSPHDSGMDENQSDIEVTNQPAASQPSDDITTSNAVTLKTSESPTVSSAEATSQPSEQDSSVVESESAINQELEETI